MLASRKVAMATTLPMVVSTRKKYWYIRADDATHATKLWERVDKIHAMYPAHDVVADIGVPHDWKRSGFIRILNETANGNVEEIVVSHRLQIGTMFESVRDMCAYFGTRVRIDPDPLHRSRMM